MQQVFKEFCFEAAHQTPPHSTLHGHPFVVEIALGGGTRDPVFGWSHNLDEVHIVTEAVRQELDHRYLNEIEGLEVPTLENVTEWIWNRLNNQLVGLERVVVRRGQPGQAESCLHSK